MNLDFNKAENGLLPAIIQDYNTLQILMLGYMNKEAFERTEKEQRVTFYSRSKKRLWTKGEKSGNFIDVNEIQEDCDNDTILIKGTPYGPTCHTGNRTCFNNKTNKGFLYQLQSIINEKIDNNDLNSYTNNLHKKGINKVVQKFGEESVELLIESKDNDENLFKNEAADLLYHYLILLKTKGVSIEDIENILYKRSK